MRESTSRNQAERPRRVPLAHGNKAQQHVGGLAAIVAPEKRPIAAAEGDITVGSLRGAVVDLQIAAFQKIATTRPTDSAHSAAPLPPGFSAELRRGSRADTCAASPSPGRITAGAAPASPRPSDVWRDLRSNTGVRSGCSAFSIRCWSESNAVKEYRSECIVRPTSVSPRTGLENAS